MTGAADLPSMDPFDVQGWAEHLSKVGEHNRVRDQARPPAEDLGTALINCWLTICRAVAKRDAPLPPPAVGFDPQSISYRRSGPEGADRKAAAKRNLNCRNELVREVLGAVVAATLDDLYSLGALIATNAPLRPTVAMARILIDAAIQVGYLADETINVDQRSARAANLRFAAIDEERKDRDPDGISEPGLTSERTAILESGVKDGLPTVNNRGNFVFEPWPNARSMALALGGDPTHDIFRVLSSAAHGQERSVLGFVTGTLAGGTERNLRARAAYFVGPAVAVAQAALFLACQYVGADTELIAPTIFSTQQLWRLGSWGHSDIDDAIRAAEAG